MKNFIFTQDDQLAKKLEKKNFKLLKTQVNDKSSIYIFENKPDFKFSKKEKEKFIYSDKLFF